ncbi:hypothetical protein CN234_24055 [Sinorhizobium meliloti]|uniref:hypothetical protein n=1 Tax=Rhizobium meliloti TaxID=382 RepID=UPI000FDC6ACF|nr:hypothetical protein [Sinorhizobium meliloti]MQX01385.1 hypothetical protein [Sinorhizobium meliloti]RVG05657.1 hypothetical protein CN234_24055 [Sinorhizobium meliloti]
MTDARLSPSASFENFSPSPCSIGPRKLMSGTSIPGRLIFSISAACATVPQHIAIPTNKPGHFVANIPATPLASFTF